MIGNDAALGRRQVITAAVLGAGTAAFGPTAANAAPISPAPLPAAPFPAAQGIFGWGASSMAGAGSREAGSMDFLGTIANGVKRPFVNYARGGQTSAHSMVFRAYYAPRLAFMNNRIPASTTRTRVRMAGIPYHASLNLNGWVSGVYGRLSCANGVVTFQRWNAATRSTAVTDTRFLAEAGRWAGPGRHLYWMGKNDLVWSQYTRQTAIDNLRRAWGMNRDRQWTHNFAFGFWVTPKDSSRVRTDVAWMNREVQRMVGTRNWLDVQTLLTTSSGLNSAPVKHLNILGNAQWAQQAKSGVVPSPLLARDGIHLNTLGYQVVANAVIPKLRSLGW